MSEARTGLTPSDRPIGETHKVTITVDKSPKVSRDPVEISASKGEQVSWECPDSKSGFTVNFPQGSPFASSSFDQNRPFSGPVKQGAELKTYKYNVTVDGNTLDPGLTVKG